MTAPGTDSGILRAVENIVAVDNHAHPLPLGVEPAADPDQPICPYDHPLPLRQRQSNPEYVAAWQALWGYEHGDAEPDHLRELITAKEKVQADQGSNYNSWVLDQLGVRTMVNIAYSGVESLPAPRFRWCSFADWLMWPVPVRSPEEPQLVANYTREVAAAVGRAGLSSVPGTLPGYVDALLRPELARRKAEGAVGLKFQTPYYRAIDFADVAADDAASIYRRGVRDGDLGPDERRALQDYLFHAIAREAGSVGLPIQMHTGLGAKPHFDTGGSNPLLMESVFTAAPHTSFVLLHAGWPFDRQAISALAHENVHLDISCATIHLYPRALAEILRGALEWFPEKVMYGTDAYSDRSLAMLSGVPVRSNFLTGWEEKAWLMDRTTRQALALALSGMRDDGVLAQDHVLPYADLVMRGNADELYGLSDA